MPEYRLNLTEDDIEESRQRTMDELHAFIQKMDGRSLAMVTLDQEQSSLWDQEGDTDYQDIYGRQIINQISDGVTETLMIRNHEGLPLALGMINGEAGWQGMGVDKRLRFEIATMFQNDETEFQ